MITSLTIFSSALALVPAPGEHSGIATLQYLSVKQQQQDAATLNELHSLASKHIRAAAIADKNGGKKVKSEAGRLIAVLTAFNEELRVLAKTKSVVLANATPEGGQRPDGRVDSSPENMRDTTRIKNGGGEAGNSGVVKQEVAVSNDAGNNALTASLKKLKGEAFDTAWHNLLASDRGPAMQLLDKTSSSSDREISKFGKKYLGMLKGAKY